MGERGGVHRQRNEGWRPRACDSARKVEERRRCTHPLPLTYKLITGMDLMARTQVLAWMARAHALPVAMAARILRSKCPSIDWNLANVEAVVEWSRSFEKKASICD